jgi:hypothetical protein
MVDEASDKDAPGALISITGDASDVAARQPPCGIYFLSKSSLSSEGCRDGKHRNGPRTMQLVTCEGSTAPAAASFCGTINCHDHPLPVAAPNDA